MIDIKLDDQQIDVLLADLFQCGFNVTAPQVQALAREVKESRKTLAQRDAQIEALENDEVWQRLANAEHQLYMKGLAIHNIKASRRAQFRKRRTAEAALAQSDAQIAALDDALSRLAGTMLNRTLDSGSKQAVAYADCADMVAKFAKQLREGKA